MNTGRTIVCSGNLLLFIGSFILLCLNAAQTRTANSARYHDILSFQQSPSPAADNFQQLSEENEETEIESAAALSFIFLLPFLLQVHNGNGLTAFIKSLAFSGSYQPSHPLYLQISTIRI